MTKTDLTRTVAAVICTMVMSATCLFGAIAPARVSPDKAPNTTVAAERQLA